MRNMKFSLLRKLFAKKSILPLFLLCIFHQRNQIRKTNHQKNIDKIYFSTYLQYLFLKFDVWYESWAYQNRNKNNLNLISCIQGHIQLFSFFSLLTHWLNAFIHFTNHWKLYTIYYIFTIRIIPWTCWV